MVTYILSHIVSMSIGKIFAADRGCICWRLNPYI